MTRLWRIIDGPKNRPFQALLSTAVNPNLRVKTLTFSFVPQILLGIALKWRVLGYEEDFRANNVDYWPV